MRNLKEMYEEHKEQCVVTGENVEEPKKGEVVSDMLTDIEKMENKKGSYGFMLKSKERLHVWDGSFCSDEHFVRVYNSSGNPKYLIPLENVAYIEMV